MGERNSEVQELDRTQQNDFVESSEIDQVDFQEGDSDFSETIVLDAKADESDNVGGSSVEINVEQLLAEFEAESADGVDESGRVRRRLEAIIERKRRHEELIDFDEYDLDS